MWAEWTSDCAACQALCCTHLAFDAGEDFGHDKEAGTSCHHLSGHRCSIHDRLGQDYRGCQRYTCFGAGQRTVALGGGAELFADLRRLHEDHVILQALGRFPLSEATEAERFRLLQALDAPGPQDALTLRGKAALYQEIKSFLKGLKPVLPHR